MIVNHNANEKYPEVKWPVNVDRNEAMAPHALGVLPTYGGNGYAKKMVGYAIEYAKKEGQEALRLDVLVGNVPAERPYAGVGFQMIERLQMYYEDTGWTTFDLYELAL